MLSSMTGFGCSRSASGSAGKISVELRSTNHKFLEIAMHLPEGFMSLEDKIKKEIESSVRRGRITCVVNISMAGANKVFINKNLIKKYLQEFKNIRGQFGFKEGISLDTLIRLPGIISLEIPETETDVLWPKIKRLLGAALGSLVRMRQKEGRALLVVMKNMVGVLKKELDFIKSRFKKVIKTKTSTLGSDEEKAAFLRDSDITEELDRLTYHTGNILQKLSKNNSVGKELDFIAQEMQRETNTIGAKSCDTLISAKVVQIKSQIEKIREQAQNIE